MNKETIKQATELIKQVQETVGTEAFYKCMSASLMAPFVGGETRHEALAKSYEIVEKSFEKYKHNVEWRYTPNNWRKMHHLPMRRKGA